MRNISATTDWILSKVETKGKETKQTKLQLQAKMTFNEKHIVPMFKNHEAVCAVCKIKRLMRIRRRTNYLTSRDFVTVLI